MKRVFFFACLFFFTAVLWACGSSFDDRSKIKLRNHVFDIPKENLYSSSLVRFFEGFGTDKGAFETLLFFTGVELANQIPGFSPQIFGGGIYYKEYVPADVVVVLSATREKNIKRAETGMNYEEMWRGIGSYLPDQLGPRVVEYDSNVGLYRVYRKQISRSWVFTNINPEEVGDKLPHDNAVIAHCTQPEREERPYSCLLSYRKGGLNISYSLREENIIHYKEVTAFIYDRLSEWEVKD